MTACFDRDYRFFKEPPKEVSDEHCYRIYNPIRPIETSDAATFFEHVVNWDIDPWNEYLIDPIEPTESAERMESGKLPEPSGGLPGHNSFCHPKRPNEVIAVYRDGSLIVSEAFVKEILERRITADDYPEYYADGGWREDERIDPTYPAGLLHDLMGYMGIHNAIADCS